MPTAFHVLYPSVEFLSVENELLMVLLLFSRQLIADPINELLYFLIMLEHPLPFLVPHFYGGVSQVLNRGLQGVVFLDEHGVLEPEDVFTAVFEHLIN